MLLLFFLKIKNIYNINNGASMAFELNSYGFSRQTLAEIITEIKDTMTETFVGQNINVEENSVFDKIITIFADRESAIQELAEDVYYSQTYTGAEGKYLDDILSKRGIFRKGKTASTGSCQLILNTLANYTDSFAIGDLKVLNSTFQNSSEFKVAGNIFAQKILNTNLVNGTTYTVTILNPNTSTTESMSYLLTSNVIGSTSLNTFYSTVKTFIVDNTIAVNDDLIQIDTVNGIIYIGYDVSLNLVGLNSLVDLKTSPAVGQRVIQIDVIANETGYQSVLAGAVTAISPEPIGFVSITNLEDFFSGSEVESDAEYRARAGATSTGGDVATRSAILTALLDEVDGVQAVKLFPNPTNNTTAEGVPPYSLMVVVYGGTTTDISEKLYEVLGINTSTYGDVSYVITTDDNDTETIYHKKATERSLSVRVKYKTTNGKQLTDSEKSSIVTEISDLANTFGINTTIFNIQLVSAVTSVVNIARFSLLQVEIKDVLDPDTAYTTDDLTPETTEIGVVQEDCITFLQVY